jgi:hypothetical protein
MRERMNGVWGAVAFAVLGGCAVEVADAPELDDLDDAGVEVTTQALGNTVTVASGLGPNLVSWNGSRALFRTGSVPMSSCVKGTQSLKRLDLGTGVATTFDASCVDFQYRAALDANGGMFIGDPNNHEILSVKQAGVMQLANTSGAPGNAMFADATHVFWVDSGGLRRLPVGDGAVQTLLSGATSLLGMDATRIYATRIVDGAVRIFQMAHDGSSQSSVPLPVFNATGFAVDSHSYYISGYTTAGGAITGKLIEVVKADGTSRELVSRPNTVSFLPVAHNVLGNQYWAEQNTTTGTFSILRRSSNGAVTVQKSNTGNITGMFIRNGAELFWSTETGDVKKASLP